MKEKHKKALAKPELLQGKTSSQFANQGLHGSSPKWAFTAKRVQSEKPPLNRFKLTVNSYKHARTLCESWQANLSWQGLPAHARPRYAFELQDERLPV